MIYEHVTFDKHNCARLGDDPRYSDDEPDQALDLERREILRLSATDVKIAFDLAIIVDNEDLTFHGMTPQELKRLGEQLIKLSGV